jgi:hypothetical protein
MLILFPKQAPLACADTQLRAMRCAYSYNDLCHKSFRSRVTAFGSVADSDQNLYKQASPLSRNEGWKGRIYFAAQNHEVGQSVAAPYKHRFDLC